MDTVKLKSCESLRIEKVANGYVLKPVPSLEQGSYAVDRGVVHVFNDLEGDDAARGVFGFLKENFGEVNPAPVEGTPGVVLEHVVREVMLIEGSPVLGSDSAFSADHRVYGSDGIDSSGSGTWIYWAGRLSIIVDRSVGRKPRVWGSDRETVLYFNTIAAADEFARAWRGKVAAE